jgi:hypothetical protein
MTADAPLLTTLRVTDHEGSCVRSCPASSEMLWPEKPDSHDSMVKIRTRNCNPKGMSQGMQERSG